jgi:outer membrane protein
VARRDLDLQRYNVLTNSLKLRQAAGVLKPEDLEQINALLVK